MKHVQEFGNSICKWTDSCHCQTHAANHDKKNPKLFSAETKWKKNVNFTTQNGMKLTELFNANKTILIEFTKIAV